METLRIGVLGCADIARRRVLPAIRRFSGTDLVAVASRDPDKARSTAAESGCEAVHGYDTLLARADIDAVYVPLPAALHARWVEAALRAGKHVLAEKPLTTDQDSTARLVTLAERHGLVLRENVMFVHHGQHRAVHRLVADGAIGEVRALHAAFAIPRLRDDDIRYDPELGGGALWDTGVYPVRAALFLLGDDLEATGATLVRGGPGRGVDIAGTALLRTPEGVGAHLAFGLDHHYRSRYEIWGSEGTIVLDRAFTPPADHVPRIRLERKGGAEDITLPAQDQVLRTVAAFAGAVRTGAGPDPAVLRQAALLDEIRRRMRAA
ncbi:Gfo/Idh/MocA family oxidoreductase [Streptomyces sp. CA-210063]|uniref:Gfo/Idh/MocA family protein n=1 Tax=Streptomyces sp. CA-210063 TaxID=2801029 RepID=UPI00214B63C2|nr:Gfo/Idh/MocA family oxidoreductase [Streptomyces sp. CA-210063]UUU30210.1 Gfo/Idh/MocA family oxidoreductase [Streptomyces sp. CA-210063]